MANNNNSDSNNNNNNDNENPSRRNHVYSYKPLVYFQTYFMRRLYERTSGRLEIFHFDSPMTLPHFIYHPEGSYDPENHEFRAKLKLLKRYYCPWEQDLDCVYQNYQTSHHCLFKHTSELPQQGQQQHEDGQMNYPLLRYTHIPKTYCIYHILSCCVYYRYGQEDPERTFCPEGYHIDFDRLIRQNLPSYGCERSPLDKELREISEDQSKYPDCLKCQRSLLDRYKFGRVYGIQENCDCTLCGKCLLQWRKQHLKCPICSVESLRYILHPNWYRMTNDREYRQEYFDYSIGIREGLNISYPNDTQMVLHNHPAFPQR